MSSAADAVTAGYGGVARVKEIMGRVATIGRRAGQLWPVRKVREALQRRRFRGSPGEFYGIFPDFAAALQQIPHARAVGYDLDPMATLYQERLDKVFAVDYPVLWWLRPVVRPGLKVFDVGGHIGLAFYAYREWLQLPADAMWTVQDVPAITRRGIDVARQRGETRLRFTERIEDVDGADVLLASGSLQYIARPLAATLSQCRRLPQHLFLNKLPLTDGEGFVTLQNTVYSFNPYHVFNRAAFVADFAALGYETIDSWDDFERSCVLSYAPERRIAAYSGIYLRHKDHV